MKPGFPRLHVMVPLLAGLSLAGCEGSTTAPSTSLGDAEIEAMALFLSDADGSGGLLAMAEGPSGVGQFSHSRPCPGGGTRSVEGTRNRSGDAGTGIVNTEWTTTQIHDACVVMRRRGGRGIAAVIDGSVTALGAATFRIPETPSAGRELLAWANYRSGTTTTTVGDQQRTCEVSVVETFDPVTRAFTMTGTICGRDVDVVRARHDKPSGD